MKYKSLLISMAILTLSLQVKSQNLISSITSYELTKEGETNLFVVNVELKNGEVILFDYRSARSPVYDSYADSNYCTIVFSDERHFFLSTAFRDTISNKWIVDYASKINKKSFGLSTIQAFNYDIKIIDGLTIEVEYELKGNEDFIKKLFGGRDITFPKTAIYTLTKDYIYDQARRVGLAINWIEVENSPRPTIKH